MKGDDKGVLFYCLPTVEMDRSGGHRSRKGRQWSAPSWNQKGRRSVRDCGTGHHEDDAGGGVGATCYRGDAGSVGGLDARLSMSAASLCAGDGVRREVEGRRRSKGAGERCSRATCGRKAGCGSALGAS